MAESTQRTLGLIKPDAVEKKVVGRILARAEEAGLRIVALKTFSWTRNQAAGFYAVHKERPFFDSLTSYMTSGPVVGIVMEGENAIRKWRDLMGDTNPEKAAEGTIRKDYGTNIERNATHGSDGEDTAAFELSYVFGGMEIAGL